MPTSDPERQRQYVRDYAARHPAEPGMVLHVLAGGVLCFGGAYRRAMRSGLLRRTSKAPGPRELMARRSQPRGPGPLTGGPCRSTMCVVTSSCVPSSPIRGRDVPSCRVNSLTALVVPSGILGTSILAGRRGVARAGWLCPCLASAHRRVRPVTPDRDRSRTQPSGW